MNLGIEDFMKQIHSIAVQSDALSKEFACIIEFCVTLCFS